MKSFFKYILFLILLNVGLVAKAETIYPIQLYATMLPPYTTCISDYITGGMNRLKLTAVVRDMNNHSFNQVRVLIQVKEGNEIRCTAYTYPAILGHGSDMMHEIPVTALNEQIINSNSKNGSKNGCLEEGAYEFVFQVFDAHNSSLPLSEPVSIYCYLTTPVPPVCIYPNEGDCINPTQNGGIINFTWMDAVASNLNRKEYVFELLEDIIPEAPSTSTLNPMFGKEDVTGKKVIFRTTIFNSNVYTLTNTVGLLNADHKYYWHVKNVTDASDDNYSNNADRYSELASFSFGDCEPDVQEEETKNVEAIADKLVITNVETDSKNVSATITWGLEGAEDATALEKFCSYKLYFTRKKDTKESGEATTASESNGENQESEENTPKEDSKVKSVDDINDEFVVEVGNVNTYTITSVERTRKYDVTVEGYVCDENNKPYQKTEKSESKEFMIPQLETEECNSNIKQVECQSLVNLKNGDSFFANDDNVVVKVKELDLSKSNDETHVYSGKGIVTCTIFKEKLGLNVTFENIKVNSDHHLCDGVVNVVNSVENNVMVNLNDVAGKDRTASKAPEQKEVKNVENKEEITDPKKNQEHRNNVVTNGSTLYAVNNMGGSEPVGTLVNDVTPSTSSLDNEDGVVMFDVEKNLENNSWTPYIDMGAYPFLNTSIVRDYERMGGSYIVPWLAMESGDFKWIKAKPTLKDNKDIKRFDDLNFYAKIGGNYYQLDSKKIENGNSFDYNVKVFGADANKSYSIYAMSKDKSKTFGRLEVYSMKNKEIKVKLVPVINKVEFENSLTDFQDRLNKIFEPLAKKFIFKMDEKPFTDADIEVEVDGYGDLDFLDEGLNTSEGSDIFANETKEMKLLRKLYKRNTSDDNSYDAYLFLIPKNAKSEIKGFMPRTYSVGYLFVGEDGKIYNDIYTAAHELCHGVFGLQHAFDYEGVVKGGVEENLMDYSTADIFRYPSKYFQWYNIENPSDYHFPFVDTPEDGEINCLVTSSVKTTISTIASMYFDEDLDKRPWYKNLGIYGGGFVYDLMVEGMSDCSKGSMDIAKLIFKVEKAAFWCLKDKINNEVKCDKVCDYISPIIDDVARMIVSRSLKKKLSKIAVDKQKEVKSKVKHAIASFLGVSESDADKDNLAYFILDAIGGSIFDDKLTPSLCKTCFCSDDKKIKIPDEETIQNWPSDNLFEREVISIQQKEEEKKENSVEKKKTVRITSSLRKKYDLSSSSKLVKTKDGYEIVDLGAENLQVKYNVKIDKDNQIINVIKKEEVPNYSVIYDFDDNPVLVVDGKKIPILEYYSPTFVVDLFNLVCVKWVGYEPFDKKLNKTLDLVINDVIENDLNKKDSFKGPGMGHSKAKKAYTYLQSMECYKSLVEDLDDEIIDAVRRVNGKNRQIKEVVKVVAEYLSFQNSTFTTDDYENLLAFTKKHDDMLYTEANFDNQLSQYLYLMYVNVFPKTDLDLKYTSFKFMITDNEDNTFPNNLLRLNEDLIK